MKCLSIAVRRECCECGIELNGHAYYDHATKEWMCTECAMVVRKQEK